jgi:hypothetical protein
LRDRAPLSILLVCLALGSASFLSAQDKPPPPDKEAGQEPRAYKAEDGLPKDEAAERRRDYAVLEAALNDLASPKNPEHKYFIENVGPRSDIVIHDTTRPRGGLGSETRNIDNQDPRSIPSEIQADFERRNDGTRRSLADFRPANPHIKMCDLDKLLGDSLFDGIDKFHKAYPDAWGYVRACRPAYSKDGAKAILLFGGGPNGIHGLDWVYMLTKKGKRWEVEWRHCEPWE